MSVWYWLITAVLLIVAVYFIIKIKKLLVFIISGIVILLLLTNVLLYKFNSDYNFWVDKTFNPTTEHWVSIDHGSALFVPVADETVLDYRFSETGATYKTGESFDQIIDFYEQGEEKNIIESLLVNNSGMSLQFNYKNTKIIISYEVVDNEQYNYITIDINE